MQSGHRLGLRGRIGRIAVVLCAAVALQGCDQMHLPGELSFKQQQDLTQYRMISNRQALIHVPDGLMTVQRTLPGELEQRVALPNETGLKGDNFLLAIARMPEMGLEPKLQLDHFLKLAGGAPYPFSKVSEGGLRSKTDALGSYFWVEQSSGVNTVCVLAIRRASDAVRQLPDGYYALDVMLRNCVHGTATEALAPITADSIAYAPVSSSDLGRQAPRNLSPLAAPQP